jgi:SAM-dependent methyltransferase
MVSALDGTLGFSQSNGDSHISRGAIMESSADWWRTFFSGWVVDSWLAIATEEQTGQEAAFIQQELAIPPPARLLDVPCGGGRHSLALARLGYDMTGVDLSSDFLAAARARPAAGPGSVAWEHREMRDLPWPGQFDGAFSFGNSFGYLDDAGHADFFKAVARALKPGARFVLETSYLVESLLSNIQWKTWYEAGDLIMLADRRYDPAEGRLHVEYSWIRYGKVDRRSMSARLYTYREIFRLLGAAGFAEIKGYGSFTREPFRVGSDRLLLTACKRPDF